MKQQFAEINKRGEMLWALLQDQAIFIALIDCWMLAELVVQNFPEYRYIEMKTLPEVYKTRAIKYAEILGPCGLEAVSKFAEMGFELQ